MFCSTMRHSSLPNPWSQRSKPNVRGIMTYSAPYTRRAPHEKSRDDTGIRPKSMRKDQIVPWRGTTDKLELFMLVFGPALFE